MNCPDCSSPREHIIRSADAMFVPEEMRPTGLFAWVLRCWECGRNESGYMNMKFIPVEKYPESATLLYRLLGERTEKENISHGRMPTWEQHITFTNSIPYLHWYIIVAEEIPVGSIYLSKAREIGVFIFRVYQGMSIGPAAVTLLMEKHPGKFLANINPVNTTSIKMFESLGFVHIQNTYKGPTGNPYERE